jgi:hypothetical protein
MHDLSFTPTHCQWCGQELTPVQRSHPYKAFVYGNIDPYGTIRSVVMWCCSQKCAHMKSHWWDIKIRKEKAFDQTRTVPER